MTYQDILNRIIEIIKLSENKKIELENDDIYDDKLSLADKNFNAFYPYHIYKDYYKEFEYLRMKELTFHLIGADKYAFLKNNSLIRECSNCLVTGKISQSVYDEIVCILERVSLASAEELIYIYGYFVCERDLEKFKTICFKNHIGINKPIKGNQEETREIFDKNAEQTKEQKMRIHMHMESLKNDISKNENIILNCKYKEIVYLGMLGKLNLKMIADLKEVMLDDEFKELTNVLLDYKLFTNEEINSLYSKESSKVKEVSDIDELVAFLSVRKVTNVEGLKVLIPFIGIDNYHYLMDQLYKFNAISHEDYFNYLREYNYLEDDIKNVR